MGPALAPGPNAVPDTARHNTELECRAGLDHVADATRAQTGRVLGRAVVGLSMAGILFLGWPHPERGRHTEAPGWDSSRFVLIREARSPGPEGADLDRGAAISEGSELWVVVLDPRCHRCRLRLARLVAERGWRSAATRIEALIVDTRIRPAVSALEDIDVDRVWWDGHAAWRRRWGRRAHGEILVFDRGGHFLRALPPGSPELERTWFAGPEVLPHAPDDSTINRLGVPPDDF